MFYSSSTFNFFLLLAAPSQAWVLPQRSTARTSLTSMEAQVGIFFGTSTGSTQDAADMIYEAFGSDVAAEPVDVDELDDLAGAFGQHDALVVGTPTWNTGADTERSGTGWDELYYSKMPELKAELAGKKVAVFGLGDQVSYAENYADGTGELFDVFQGLGCTMLGAWSQEGYEHEASKSIRGDKFCGLLLDAVNQEELTGERVEQWVAQLQAEGILNGPEGGVSQVEAAPAIEADAAPTSAAVEVAPELEAMAAGSAMLDESIGQHSTGGFTPYLNKASGQTMWVSQDGRQSFVTKDTAVNGAQP